MTSLPDKPFRDSLEHYKKSPPPQAWNRIESGLHKNKTRNIRMSTAAAVILLISASFLLWHSNESHTTTPPLAAEQKFETESIHQIPFTPSTTAPIPSTKTKSEPVAIYTSHKVVSAPRVTPSISEEVNSTANATNESITGASIPQVETTTIIAESAPAPATTSDVASSPVRSNKIVYSSGEVNSRFLKKDSATSVIVPTPEKPQTGIQKIIGIASNLKYEENALGELREMKNEILSLPRREATADKNK